MKSTQMVFTMSSKWNWISPLNIKSSHQFSTTVWTPMGVHYFSLWPPLLKLKTNSAFYAWWINSYMYNYMTCYGVKGFSGSKTRIPVNDLKWWSPWPFYKQKKPTTNVCPIEPENSRVQKQNLWSLLYLALILTLKKKKIKLWSKTNDLTWKNPIYFRCCYMVQYKLRVIKIS